VPAAGVSLPISSGAVAAAGGLFPRGADEQEGRIEPLLPPTEHKVERPFAEHRPVVDAIDYRYRTGCRWRDMPREEFGPWRTVWKRRYAHFWTSCSSTVSS
jgi:transposase